MSREIGVGIGVLKGQRQDFRKVEHRQGVFRVAADFQVHMAHGAGGDDAVGAGLFGVADDLLHHGADHIGPDHREKSAAASPPATTFWRIQPINADLPIAGLPAIICHSPG